MEKCAPKVRQMGSETPPQKRRVACYCSSSSEGSGHLLAGPKEATKAHACSVMLAGRTRTPSLPLSFGGVTLKFIIPGSLLLSFLRRHEQLAKLQHFNACRLRQRTAPFTKFNIAEYFMREIAVVYPAGLFCIF